MLKEANIKILDDILFLLKQVSNSQYGQSLEVINGKTVGDHVRHILDFYDCLINAKEEICYDNRSRKSDIANNKLKAEEKIESIKSAIYPLDLNRNLVLHQSIDGNTMDISTHLKRELFYNLEHAIHHMAIMKIAVSSAFPNVSLSDSFGVAFSTLAYEKSHHQKT